MNKDDFLKNAFSVKPERAGDRLRVAISGTYGSCMSLYNTDVLDQASLRYAQELVEGQVGAPFYVADIGASPYCPQALRFASLGLHVDAFDLEPPAHELLEVISKLPGSVHYIEKNLLDLDKGALHHRYRIVYSNRCLLFLPFEGTRKLLNLFIANMLPGARAYLSVGNIKSSDAKDYPDRHKSIGERFSAIDNAALNEADIKAPICLYHFDEVKTHLLEGFPVNVVSLNQVGESLNAIKLIFEKI